MNRTGRIFGYCSSLAAVSILTASVASAHLPAYEGERVRNDNHFTTQGFAWPVRGACDVSGFGASDENAGSANIFLGPENTPPNFFCLYAAQDDWSFDYPVDIIESSRTPGPDPTMLGQPLEEGYIPCSPFNPNPFQCPRQMSDPRQPGVNIDLPGECVNLGQPDDPAASAEPDGNYHCALLPGSPRPRTSSVLFSTLTPYDVNWAVYRYDPAFAEQPIVGSPQVPACRENLHSFVTFAYAGPLDMIDARTGEPLFEPLNTVGSLPTEVMYNLPEGYGIRVSRPSPYYWPSRSEPRAGYASGFAQNAWLLAQDSVVECIDDFERCLEDDTGELSKHYTYNDIFFVDEDEPVNLYLMWWVNDTQSWWPWPKLLTDVSITTGVIDQFLVGDFINIGKSGPFSGNGRYIHGRCTDPRTFGQSQITIENNN